MKSEKGITLAILAITIIIMVILASAVVGYGTNSLRTAKLKNFSYELKQIQGKVDTLYEKIKLGEEEHILLGRNITESRSAINVLRMLKKIDYENMNDKNNLDYYTADGQTCYRYFTGSDLEDELNITSDPGEVIINFLTKEVISVRGFEYEGRTYYRLSEIGTM